MTLTSCPGPDLLLLHHHGLLDEPEDAAELARVETHVACCVACRDWTDEALTAPALPFDPAAALPALRARIDAWETEAAPSAAVDLDVRLLCTYCKDGLGTTQAIYCATCLAPHHDDCFAEHGLCSAPGCVGRDVVRTAEPTRTATGPRRVGLLTLGLLLGGGAVAALAPAAAPPSPRAPSRQLVAEPVAARDTAAPALRRYPIGDLLSVVPGAEPGGEPPDWKADYRQILASRKVTLNLPDTPIREVVGFLQDITGLNIVLELEGDVEPTVSVRLREILLADALRIILDQAGLAATLANESYVIHDGDGVWAFEPSHPSVRPIPYVLDGSEVVFNLERALELELGEAGGGPLRVDGTDLVAVKSPAAHAAIARQLAAIRRGQQLPAVGLAWQRPGGAPPATPGLTRALDVARRLRTQRVTLNFDETPLADAARFVRDITGIAVTLDPSLGDLSEHTVSLRLREISLENALTLMFGGLDSRLVWDVDRRGITLRTSATPAWEHRLREAAGRALTERGPGDALRQALLDGELSLHFDAAPLTEVVTYVQDVTGLNLVLSGEARAVAARPVSVDLEAQSVYEALDACLRPLGLGFRFEVGAVVIVPRSQAEERADLRERVAALEAQPVALPPQWAFGLGQVVGHLETALGVPVVLDEDGRRARAPLALPGGCFATAQVLELLALQGVRAAWTCLDGEPVLALGGAPTTVIRAAGLIGRDEALPSSAPAWLAALAVEARAAGRVALTSLDRRDPRRPGGIAPVGTRGLTWLGAALGELDAALNELEEIQRLAGRYGSDDEGPAPDVVLDVMGLALDLHAESVYQRRATSAKAWALERLAEEAERDYATRAPDHDAKIAALQARIDREQDPVVRMGLEDRMVILANQRVHDETRAAGHRAERERVLRDAKLEEARLLSRIRETRARVQELCRGVGLRLSGRLDRLAGGEAWEDVFPEGFEAASRADDALGDAVIERGLVRLSRLGVVIGDGYRVERVSLGSPAQQQGVAPGATLISANGETVQGGGALLLAVGRSQARQGELVFQSEGGDRVSVRYGELNWEQLTGDARLAPDPARDRDDEAAAEDDDGWDDDGWDEE